MGLTSSNNNSTLLCFVLGMFENCSSFDQDVSFFDVSNVADLSDVFAYATSYTNGGADLLWDVQNAMDMTGLFDSTRYNGNLSNWDVQKVTSFSWMFHNNTAFQGYTISDWVTSSAAQMEHIFDGCTNFRANLESWDVSRVQDFEAMFRGCHTWTSDLFSWNISSATDLSHQFEGCEFFNRNLESWDTSQVTSMNSMFKGASSFFGFLSTWNVGKVADFSFMFQVTPRFDGDIAQWNVSAATSLTGMLQEATSFNRNISQWNVNRVESMDQLFMGASSFDQTLCWQLNEDVDVTDMFTGSLSCFDPTCLDESMLEMFPCLGYTTGESTNGESGSENFGDSSGAGRCQEYWNNMLVVMFISAISLMFSCR